MNFLKRWLDLLQTWLDSFFDKKILSRTNYRALLTGDGWTAILLERNTPGAVATWRFNCLVINKSILITIDNLLDLQRHFKRQERQLNGGFLREEIKPEKQTHRVAISLLAGDKKVIGVWDLNLIDNWSAAHAEDYKAEKIALSLVRRLSTNFEKIPEILAEQINQESWWRDRLLACCSYEFQPNHPLYLELRKWN